MGTTTIGTRRLVKRSEMGGAGVKFFISAIILALLAQALYVAIPIYVAVYDFASQVDKEAQFGSQKNNRQIKEGLLKYAEDLKLPVGPDAIQVERTKSELKVSAHFVVPVETLLYTYNWDFETSKAYPLF